MKEMKSWELREVERINTCIAQAEDFLKKANTLKVYLETNKWTSQTMLRSSAKRSSMDLTRELANLRKPK